MAFRLLVLLYCITPLILQAGGVRGVIRNEDGEALAYATIYIKALGTGTTTNAQGFYEVSLEPGTHELVFQYMGYVTQVHQIQVGPDWSTLNISMKVQVTMLRPVEVYAKEEDPAYTIMRKAMAKANYHRNQLDQYSARVYIKGTGKLKDYPWLAKKG